MSPFEMGNLILLLNFRLFGTSICSNFLVLTWCTTFPTGFMLTKISSLFASIYCHLGKGQMFEAGTSLQSYGEVAVKFMAFFLHLDLIRQNPSARVSS